MAITASRVTSGGLVYRIIGAQKETITDITFDSSYPTGGEAVTAADLGLARLDQVVSANIVTASGGGNAVDAVAVSVTNTGCLIKLNAAAAEVANAANLTTTTTLVVRVVARGA